MKKGYAKPDVFFEDFSLSTNIAICEWKTDTPVARTCGVPYDNAVLFIEGVSGCDIATEDNGSLFDGVCYHVPHESNNMFNS